MQRFVDERVESSEGSVLVEKEAVSKSEGAAIVSIFRISRPLCAYLEASSMVGQF